MPGISQRNQRKDEYLKRKYGITLKQWKAMYRAQRGCCGVCGKPFNGKRIYTDHCHKTQRVRGLLDYVCNRRVIGRRSDAALYRKAAEYLERKIALGLEK